VEALIRGYAFAVPGSIWNRWKKDSSTVGEPIEIDQELIVPIQQQLIERLWEEGYGYMEVRNMQLEEKLMRKKQSVDDITSPSYEGHTNNEQDKVVKDDVTALANFLKESEKQDVDTGNSQQELSPGFMHNFALPGPTVAMYDTILDVMACQAATMGSIATMDMADQLLDTIITRHRLDGGDAKNDNVHTRPTALSYNAPIRLAAAVPYDGIDIQLRDQAVALAFSNFAAIEECDMADVQRNSASVTYTLKVVAKYMPPSRIRGNIARGLFHLARYYCFVNKSVLEAFKEANTPSNSEEHDEFIEKTLQEIHPKWKQESRKRQYSRYEDTY
jgi:predicted RNA-binding protein with EMAP domain